VVVVVIIVVVVIVVDDGRDGVERDAVNCDVVVVAAVAAVVVAMSTFVLCRAGIVCWYR